MLEWVRGRKALACENAELRARVAELLREKRVLVGALEREQAFIHAFKGRLTVVVDLADLDILKNELGAFRRTDDAEPVG